MKYIAKYLTVLVIAVLVARCYDIQGSYDYTPYNCSPYINMTSWEFIESRQDIFSLLKESIEFVDENYPGFKELYTQTSRKYTYLHMTNEAFVTTNGVFNRNNTPSHRVRDMDPAVLRNVLYYHMVDGFYHTLDVSGSLSFTPINVITLLRTSEGAMTLKMDDNTGRSRYSTLRVNAGVHKRRERVAVSSNIMATNGAIHVFDAYLLYEYIP